MRRFIHDLRPVVGAGSKQLYEFRSGNRLAKRALSLSGAVIIDWEDRVGPDGSAAAAPGQGQWQTGEKHDSLHKVSDFMGLLEDSSDEWFGHKQNHYPLWVNSLRRDCGNPAREKTADKPAK